MRIKVHGQSYRGYPLRQCDIEEKNNGFYREILDRINDLLCCCREHYSKVYFVWFILKYPADSEFANCNDNEVFSKFMESMCLQYKREYPMRKFHPDGRRKIQLPLYLRVREISDSGQPHYHVVMVYNGQTMQTPQEIFYRARDLWAGCLSRAVDSVPIDFGYSDYEDGEGKGKNPFRYGGYRIDHYKDHETVVYHYIKMFEFLSYYGKIYSKSRNEDPSNKTNNFSCSQIPRYKDTIREVDLMMRYNK